LHLALFEVTRGTFAFIAGEVAKIGSLRVDTPVGSIRGRAHASGFGMLSLAALTFSSMMKEVQAAAPNATFLDDGSITYKDLEHGVFELVTKEAIPRHIIVEDPGETIVLSRRGSSVNVDQVTNSAARMQELQAAQRDVLANLTTGPNGSSTPPFFNPLPVQPINFIQTEAPTGQNSLPPLLSAPFVVPEIILVRPPPTLNAGSGPTEIDTVVFDTFTATSGTFTASSPKSDATLTFGVSGGIAGNTVLGGVTYDLSRPGPFGTLYVNSTTGTYTLVPDSHAINALKAPTTENFVITVSDGSLSGSQAFTIAINGTNDAAIISGTTTGSVIEAGGVANASPGTPSATGTLTDTDVDDPPNTFVAVSSPTKSTSGYGSFTMTAAGVWTYTLDNANSAVQALHVSDTLTDTFTVTTVDGTPQVVTITINGANDAAIISGTTTGSVIEAGGVANATPGTPTATGTLTDADVDNGLNAFTAVSSPTASAGGYGTFTITAAGVWTYSIDNANSAVQALNVGNTLTDTFTVTSVDGTPQVVTITISGSNDAAIISGTTAGSVIEAGGVASATPGTPTATGTLTDTDVDNAPNAFTTITSTTASAGGYGTFTITAAGIWTYTLDNGNSAVQALNVGARLTDSFTVTTVDGTSQVVTIAIDGSNDAAIISGTAISSVIEAGGISPGTPIASGTLTDTDVDNPPNTFTAVSAPTASDGGYGFFTMTAAGVWTYTLDNASGAVDALDVGGTLTDTFTVHAVDGTAQVVTITIHGASDADPNDFDNLAVGATVITDPPFVFGTPGGDSIAGGGSVGQIIYGGAGDDTLNGTGVNDIIYGGSGNDTIKGNNGDDTIYGGSGSDTINGNNGADTIIGGFGADQLTGSNGDDRFVYLSAVDSHAGQFDTITDFISGSDKIDLTALGALAFLALTPTSTSVPAHTIAWLYDSTSNETIVYVNPTDQTLSIGDSGLLEIHLQGIATIQASDFVTDPAPAVVVVAGESIDLALAATVENDGIVDPTNTADVLSVSTVSDSALIADGSWTLQTTDEYFGFDAARDRIDSIDHAGGRNCSTEDSSGDAVITLASGQSIEPNRAQVTAPVDSTFAFGQTPGLQPIEHGTTPGDDGWIAGFHSHWNSNSAMSSIDTQHHADNTPSREGQLGNGELNPTNAGPIHADGTHGHTIDAGPNVDHGASGSHGPMDASSNANSRGPWTDGGHQTNLGEANGHGVATMGGTGAPDFEASSNADKVFGSGTAGTRGLGDSFHFKDKISGLGGSGVVDPADAGFTPAPISHRENVAGANGAHAVSGETHASELSGLEQHSTDNFSIVPNQAAGGAVVTHVPHDLIV
jgi:VCBS repeat-containing protein